MRAMLIHFKSNADPGESLRIVHTLSVNSLALTGSFRPHKKWKCKSIFAYLNKHPDCVVKKDLGTSKPLLCEMILNVHGQLRCWYTCNVVQENQTSPHSACHYKSRHWPSDYRLWNMGMLVVADLILTSVLFMKPDSLRNWRTALGNSAATLR